MIKLFPMLPFVAALGLLACQNDGPVADESVVPPDELLGDRSARGSAAPGNAGEAEALDQAALPPAQLGMRWSVAGTKAAFGPPGAPAILTISCPVRGGRLSVTRHDPASPGSKATMSFTGSGHIASLPVSTIAAAGVGQAEWQGRATGDSARAVARSFSRTGQVEISVGGAPSIVVPADAGVQRLFAECLQT